MQPSTLQQIKILNTLIKLSPGTTLGVSSTNITDLQSLNKQLMDAMRALPVIQKKNRTLLLLIDHHEMLDPAMNVLEYLMFATKYTWSHTANREQTSVIRRQQELFELLSHVGLGYISLSSIQYLTKEEKMLILLIAALYSTPQLLFFDVSSYDFSTEQIESMKGILEQIRLSETALIVSTLQAKLIGICLTDTLFLHQSNVQYYGSVDKLYHSMDRVLYVISHHDQDFMIHSLTEIMPEYEIRFNANLIFVMKQTGERNDSAFFTALTKHNVFPDQLKINHGRVENSFQELIEFNDISNKLI